jgi:toxin FitB
MILLDTNVLSEPLRAAPDANVLDWLDAQAVETLFLSAISLAKLRFGIAALPQGRRRDTLQSSLDQLVLPNFNGRILPFRDSTSQVYADMRTRARASGKAIAPTDGYIAAIALEHGLAVATRDKSPFEAAGLTVIDPWAWVAN